MYDSSPRETVPTTPSDVGDCAAKKLSENQFVRANKLSLFHIRKRKSLSDVDLAKKKVKHFTSPALRYSNARFMASK